MKGDHIMTENKGCGCNGDCNDEKEDSCCGGDHDHECGCGNDHEHDVQKITLTLDSGDELVCSVLGTFDFEEQSYIALLPEDGEDVFIYAYKQDGEEIELLMIETDEEYERVGDFFMELVSED